MGKRGNAEEILLDVEQAWTRNVAAGYPEEQKADWLNALGPGAPAWRWLVHRQLDRELASTVRQRTQAPIPAL